jgi:hypothetical protein
VCTVEKHQKEEYYLQNRIKMKKKEYREQILHTLKEKSSTKQEVYDITYACFKEMKHILEQMADEIAHEMDKYDKRVKVEFFSTGEFEARFKIGGDMLVFHMHSNIFKIEDGHPFYNHEYLKKNDLNSFCGTISIYNFLADSFKYNRINDSGYLVSRTFINKERHFFVEGRRRLSFLFNDFTNAVVDTNKLKDIIESSIIFALDFDLQSPKFNSVQRFTVNEMSELSNNLKLSTEKKLGFRFSYEGK